MFKADLREREKEKEIYYYTKQMSPSKCKIKLKEKKRAQLLYYIILYTDWKQWREADVKRLQ